MTTKKILTSIDTPHRFELFRVGIDDIRHEQERRAMRQLFEKRIHDETAESSRCAKSANFPTVPIVSRLRLFVEIL